MPGSKQKRHGIKKGSGGSHGHSSFKNLSYVSCDSKGDSEEPSQGGS